VSAELEGLEPFLALSYQAENVALSWQINDPLLKIATWTAWSKQTIGQRPARPIRFAFNTSEKVELNTEYRLAPDSEFVRAMCIDAHASHDAFHHAIDGTITFNSLPAKGSNKGTMTATFNFKGKQSNGYVVNVSNGQLCIEN
jgi:hypothetical protein